MTSDYPGGPPPTRRGETAAWTRDQAARVERSTDTVAPIFYPPETDPASDVHVWDTWLLRERDGSIATVDGYRIAFSLTADADLLPGTRHDVARVGYFYSENGTDWRYGGDVFENGTAFGSRQWSGSALHEDGRIYLYYTAVGRRGEADISYEQRIAVAAGGRVETGGGIAVVGPWAHELLLEGDGEYYQTQEQASDGMIYTFRDPWFFEDPRTGRSYLLFEGNTPVTDDDCDGDADQRAFNGSVGVAESPTGDPTDWKLRPPLLDAVCVNQELERPHAVVRDGRYYLFVSSHVHTFAPGLDGYDALYGFVADDLRGDYRPLNDSGLVVANPANAPYQAYSWLAFPHGDELLVSSFFNYYDFDGHSLDLVADLPPDEQRRRFGGTLSPTLRLALDGDRTRIRGRLAHWHIPTEDEPLPTLPAERRAAPRTRLAPQYAADPTAHPSGD